MRVCWNRQTGTFEGRVSLTYGFESRHSHQKDRTSIGCPVFLAIREVTGLEQPVRKRAGGTFLGRRADEPLAVPNKTRFEM